MFRLRTFGKRTRNLVDIQKEELKISERLNLMHRSLPIDDFQDPFISCAFVSDKMIFVGFFYTPFQQHHHFMYDLSTHTIIGESKREDSTVMLDFNCSRKNFPLKCFYNDETDMIFMFYRQGESLWMKKDNIDEFKIEDISDMDLG